MWQNYAGNSEGICLVYNLIEIILFAKSRFKIFPVRYVDNRELVEDIRFGVSDYGKFDECYENERRKYILSRLTKNKNPYYREAEWRIFSEYEELPDKITGKKFDFFVKPKAIITGKNIARNPKFESRVINYAEAEDIKLFTEEELNT